MRTEAYKMERYSPAVERYIPSDHRFPAMLRRSTSSRGVSLFPVEVSSLTAFSGKQMISDYGCFHAYIRNGTYFKGGLCYLLYRSIVHGFPLAFAGPRVSGELTND